MKMVNSNSFNTPAACCGEIYLSVNSMIEFSLEIRFTCLTVVRIARKGYF